MGASGLLSGPAPYPLIRCPLTNQFVDITCDNYELRTNLAFFREQVRVSDRLAINCKGQMSCAQLTPHPHRHERTAEDGGRAPGGNPAGGQEIHRRKRLMYTGTNGLLELTGDPRWQAGPREGKGDRIRVNLPHDEMLVRGNAYMRLPAAEMGQSAFSAAGKPKRGRIEGERRMSSPRCFPRSIFSHRIRRYFGVMCTSSTRK